GNDDPMPRLSAVVCFIGAHFTAPGIGANGGYLLVVYPVCRFKSQARSFTARIAAPFTLFKATFHVAGAYDDEVATPHLHALGLLRGLEIAGGNGLAVFERVDSQVPGDV